MGGFKAFMFRQAYRVLSRVIGPALLSLVEELVSKFDDYADMTGAEKREHVLQELRRVAADVRSGLSDAVRDAAPWLINFAIELVVTRLRLDRS